MAQSAGYKAKIKYAASDSGYVSVTGVTNVSVNDGIDELDITDLASDSGNRAFIMGLRGATLSFDMDEVYGNTEQDAIRSAYAARTLFWVEVLYDGTHGFKCAGYITAYNRTDSVDGKAMANLTFRVSGAITVV